MSEETDIKKEANDSSDDEVIEKPTWLKPQHDANAQHLSEVLRDVTRLVSDWVWEVSPDLEFTYMSPRIFETLGIHPAELRGKTLMDLGAPIDDSGDPVHINWRQPFRGQLFAAKNKLNDERLIELNGLPVYDPTTGEFIGVRGTATDKTDERRYDKNLKQAKEEAEALNRLRSDFLNSLADEIRIPLHHILGSSRHIISASSDSDLSGIVDDIQTAGNRLLTLAGDIHYLAQLETGETRFSLESLLPSDIIDECLQDVTPLARERKVRILGVHHWDGRIAVDRERFKQVLTNLITNGVKFNRLGGQLTVASSREDSRRYRLCITDEGESIPEKHMGDLFQPFSRLRDTDDDDHTGLALAITKQLVEGMDGLIGYSPGPSEGSTFWVEFPAINRIE